MAVPHPLGPPGPGGFFRIQGPANSSALVVTVGTDTVGVSLFASFLLAFWLFLLYNYCMKKFTRKELAGVRALGSAIERYGKLLYKEVSLANDKTLPGVEVSRTESVTAAEVEHFKMVRHHEKIFITSLANLVDVFEGSVGIGNAMAKSIRRFLRNYR